MFSIQQASASNSIQKVVDLANEIWVQHYEPIIGVNQVKYMLNKFQSYDAIIEQIADGQLYYLAEFNQVAAGYISLIPDVSEGKMMISKIYVKLSVRGNSIGKKMLKFVEHECCKHKLNTLWLTVNRNNHDSISWYKSQGFEVACEVKKDIGNGYVMDDYVMEKQLDER